MNLTKTGVIIEFCLRKENRVACRVICECIEMRVYLKTHKMELTTWWTLKTKSMKFNDRKNIASSGG